MPQQTVAGVHTRLWARAFVVADPKDTRSAPTLVSLQTAVLVFHGCNQMYCMVLLHYGQGLVL